MKKLDLEKWLGEEIDKKAYEDLIKQRERLLIEEKQKLPNSGIKCFECGTYLVKEKELYYCTRCKLHIEPEHLKNQKLLAMSVTLADLKEAKEDRKEQEEDIEYEVIWEDEIDL
jgi:hypothetical protein